MLKLNIKTLLLLTLAGVLATGCKKALEIDPPSNERASSTIFKSDKTAISALSGLYSSFSQSTTQVTVLTHWNSLLSDELAYLGASLAYDDFINNNLDPLTTTSLQTPFAELYAAIYKANSIIEGLNNNVGTTAAVKKRLIGESKFIRAYCYYYLVNLFGDVPLVLVTDPAISAFQPRAAAAMVTQQIIADLTASRDSLAADYTTSSGDRLAANKYTAAALLARVQLYNGNYAAAEENASLVIGNATLFKMIPAATMGTGVFVKNSTEAILQFPSYLNVTNAYTYDAATFIPATYITSNMAYSLRPAFWSKFASGDLRAQRWVKDTTIAGVAYRVPLKYKYRTNALAVAAGVTECPMVLRLSEQYLIRAEARARQNKLTDAVADYNVVHTRAGLTAGSYTDTDVFLKELTEENAREFFCELGHRWIYLKHSGTIDAVMSAVKTTWASTDALYPIPQNARDANANLTQNAGYRP